MLKTINKLFINALENPLQKGNPKEAYVCRSHYWVHKCCGETKTSINEVFVSWHFVISSLEFFRCIETIRLKLLYYVLDEIVHINWGLCNTKIKYHKLDSCLDMGRQKKTSGIYYMQASQKWLSLKSQANACMYHKLDSGVYMARQRKQWHI